MKLATNCRKLARLCDLQTQLLSENICVLGLSKMQIRRFVATHQNHVEVGELCCSYYIRWSCSSLTPSL